MSTAPRLAGLLVASRRQLLTAWFALRDREASWAARLLAVATVAYVISPIDLVPDVIPVLGWLDDLGVLRLGLWLLLRFSPGAVLRRAALRAESADARARIWMRWLLIALAVWLLMLLAFGGWLLWQLTRA